MNRAFLSLYFVLILSVVGLGWLTDKVWQHYLSETDPAGTRKDLVLTFSELENVIPEGELNSVISAMAKRVNMQATLYDVNEFSQSSLYQKIIQGETVMITESPESTVYYRLMPNRTIILSLKDKTITSQKTVLYRALILLFYTLIGVVVYLWFWPLTRDLKKLRESTNELAKSGELNSLNESSRSAIYDVQKAFNIMANRIRSLLATQKEMTHAISHELRTPLARMKFSLASLDMLLPDNKNVHSINDDVQEMESLISSFLNYASFEARSENLDFQPGELEPLIVRVVEQSNLSKHINIINSLSETTVQCEWYLIEHCVTNILNNASRYFKSQILITLEDDNGRYCITVCDDGPGISDEIKPTLFDAFTRQEKGTGSGFGLGLALVRRIMRWHNGDVCVVESPLGGAGFQLTWRKPGLSAQN